MSWTPKTNIIDGSAIDANALAFIAANQPAALSWANGGAALKPFNFLADNIENLDLPNLPTLTVTGTEESFNYDSDLLECDFRIDFESIVFGKNANTLPALAHKYAAALKSMLANITTAQLLVGVPGEQQVLGAPSLAVNYRETAISSQLSGFIQVFQLRAVYRLITKAEN